MSIFFKPNIDLILNRILSAQRLQPIKVGQKFAVTILTHLQKTVLFFEMFLQKHDKA